MWIFSRKLGRPGKFKDKVLKGLYDAELKETSLIFISKEPKWKEEIKAVLVRQLSPDRHVFKTTYVNSRKQQERGQNVGNKKQQHR